MLFNFKLLLLAFICRSSFSTDESIEKRYFNTHHEKELLCFLCFFFSKLDILYYPVFPLEISLFLKHPVSDVTP